MSRSLVALAALVASLSVGGCGALDKKDDDAEARALTGAAATGPRVERDAYSFRAPKGWGRIDRKIDGVDAKKSVFDLDDRDGFADNINVVDARLGDAALKDMESAALNELGKVGAGERRVRERVLVAGEATVHLSSLMHSAKGNYYIEQYSPKKGNRVFIITFAFSPDVPVAQRERVAESVLATWKWTD